MRMLLLVYDVDFDDEVMEMLGRLPWQATPNGTGCWARERDQNPSSMMPCGRDSITLWPSWPTTRPKNLSLHH